MARIRSIKPETFADELLGTVPRDLRLLYIGLWTLSDDEGRFRARPALVRSALFPYDEDLSQHQVGDWLRTLAEKERIALYEFGGQQYGVVLRWSKHQKIDHPAASKLPAPPKSSTRKASAELGKSSRDNRETLARAREVLALEGKGREGIGTDLREPIENPEPATEQGLGIVAAAFEKHLGKFLAGKELLEVRHWIARGVAPARIVQALDAVFAVPSADRPRSAWRAALAMVRDTAPDAPMVWRGSPRFEGGAREKPEVDYPDLKRASEDE